MNNTDFQNKMNDIQEKIGQDASNLILDEIGLLLTDNQAMNTSLADKDKEIERLKKTNETLQNVNGNLLQQVAMADDPDTKDPDDDKKKEPFDFRSVFDEKRKFQTLILTKSEISYTIKLIIIIKGGKLKWQLVKD